MPGFWFELTPQHLQLGVGMYMLQGEPLDAFRQSIIHPRSGKALLAAIAALKGRYEIGGKTRKLMPRGFDTDADRRDYLLYEGLYTHIASNKIRSMLLLAGLFLLIYVMVFAGALIAEVILRGTNRTAMFYLNGAWRDLIVALPWATTASALWIVIAYFFHQSIIDAVTGGHDVDRKEQPRLYNLLENLCISRGIPMPVGK